MSAPILQNRVAFDLNPDPAKVPPFLPENYTWFRSVFFIVIMLILAAGFAIQHTQGARRKAFKDKTDRANAMLFDQGVAGAISGRLKIEHDEATRLLTWVNLTDSSYNLISAVAGSLENGCVLASLKIERTPGQPQLVMTIVFHLGTGSISEQFNKTMKAVSRAGYSVVTFTPPQPVENGVSISYHIRQQHI